MSFMQKQIYYGDYFEVETTQGNEIVPCDVIGRTMSVDVSALLDYLEGSPWDNDAMIDVQTGYLARMTAPGYLDCTSWGVYETESEARVALDRMYGED